MRISDWSSDGCSSDLAQAYVVAHEVGHHIQNLTGTLDEARAAQSRLSVVEGNAVQVQVELQADCYAGVWAASERAAIEPGDIQEGMTAASARKSGVEGKRVSVQVDLGGYRIIK